MTPWPPARLTLSGITKRYPGVVANHGVSLTVLALASLGLLINEKAGIVNLGAEGMMLCAAIAGYAAVVHTGSDWLGFAAGMGAGAAMAASPCCSFTCRAQAWKCPVNS